MRQANKVGGGAQTNKNGLVFEQTTSLREIFEIHPDFTIDGFDVKQNGKVVATLCGKWALYKNVLKQRGVDYASLVSKLLLPDEALLVGDTVYIIEKKFQGSSGSVDEKLQTCDFKKKQYTKLFKPAGIKVEYIYVLNDWFKQDSYKDVHDYIKEVGCHFYFNEIPLKALGLNTV